MPRPGVTPLVGPCRCTRLLFEPPQVQKPVEKPGGSQGTGSVERAAKMLRVDSSSHLPCKPRSPFGRARPPDRPRLADPGQPCAGSAAARPRGMWPSFGGAAHPTCRGTRRGGSYICLRAAGCSGRCMPSRSPCLQCNTSGEYRATCGQAAMQRQPLPACGQGASPSAPLVVTRGDVQQSVAKFAYPSAIRVRQVVLFAARSRIAAAFGAKPFREPHSPGKNAVVWNNASLSKQRL
eukprot:scaffold59551_cov57-Phaeocystis_antarctica.AAC.1